MLARVVLGTMGVVIVVHAGIVDSELHRAKRKIVRRVTTFALIASPGTVVLGLVYTRTCSAAVCLTVHMPVLL
jgi:hypothetical protein